MIYVVLQGERQGNLSSLASPWAASPLLMPLGPVECCCYLETYLKILILILIIERRRWEAGKKDSDLGAIAGQLDRQLGP
jgi:hypothetical protein